MDGCWKSVRSDAAIQGWSAQRCDAQYIAESKECRRWHGASRIAEGATRHLIVMREGTGFDFHSTSLPWLRIVYVGNRLRTPQCAGLGNRSGNMRCWTGADRHMRILRPGCLPHRATRCCAWAGETL
jgi:hypothetical protein